MRMLNPRTVWGRLILVLVIWALIGIFFVWYYWHLGLFN